MIADVPSFKGYVNAAFDLIRQNAASSDRADLEEWYRRSMDLVDAGPSASRPATRWA